MDIKPIKTKKDYETALKEIDRLFSAVPGTREGGPAGSAGDARGGI